MRYVNIFYCTLCRDTYRAALYICYCSSVSFLPQGKKAAFTAAVSKPQQAAGRQPSFTPEKGLKLFELIPNTILLAAFGAAGVEHDIPFLMKSLYNGMLCDFQPANVSVGYGSDYVFS